MGHGAYILAGAPEEVAGAEDVAVVGLALVQQQNSHDEHWDETILSPEAMSRVQPGPGMHGPISPFQVGIPLQELGRNDLAGTSISLTCRGN